MRTLETIQAKETFIASTYVHISSSYLAVMRVLALREL